MEIRCITEKEEVTFLMNEVHKYTLNSSDEHALTAILTPLPEKLYPPNIFRQD